MESEKVVGGFVPLDRSPSAGTWTDDPLTGGYSIYPLPRFVFCQLNSSTATRTLAPRSLSYHDSRSDALGLQAPCRRDADRWIFGGALA